MSEAYPSKYTLKTPIGDVEIDYDRTEIKKFVREIVQETENRRTLFHEEVADFLSLEIGEENEEFIWWEEKDVPSLLLDFNNFVDSAGYKIRKLINYNQRRTNHTSVVKKNMKFPHGDESLVYKGVYFVESDNGLRFVISLYPSEGCVEVIISYDSSVCSATDFTEPFERFHLTKGVLKNASFNAEMKFLKYDEKEWQDIILTETQKVKIDRNITKFVENIDFFKTKELPLSRGILITGPPGTGKTLLCNTIMSQTECTFIYITSDHVKHRGDIMNMYSLARSLSPTIIVVEDIDTLGTGDREDYGGDHPLLGEFLNCLAGIQTNEQVITIATTNYPQKLDKALIDRPGRFDVRLDFGLPDKELRKTIFKRYLRNIKYDKIDFKNLIKETEGMTGAYLKEIVILAYMEGLENNDYNDDFILDGSVLIEKAKMISETRSKHKFYVKDELSNSAMFD